MSFIRFLGLKRDKEIGGVVPVKASAHTPDRHDLDGANNSVNTVNNL